VSKKKKSGYSRSLSGKADWEREAEAAGKVPHRPQGACRRDEDHRYIQIGTKKIGGKVYKTVQCYYPDCGTVAYQPMDAGQES
jgi:hypothetical protein